MAAERGETATLHPQFQAAPDPGMQHPGLKTEEQEPAGRDLGGIGVPRFLSVGSGRDFLAGETSQRVKLEPEEGVQQQRSQPQQHWDAPRQYPKPQFPPPGWKDPLLHKSLRWETNSFHPVFEPLASASQWSSGGDWVPQILPGLTVEAPPAYSSQDRQERRNHYESMKEETSNQERVSPELRRQRFRHHRYQETEGPREVCRQLQELCHQWLRPERRTKEQILELLILEQFMAVLPREIQNWVREHGPETCAQAVALSEDFLMRQREAQRKEQQVLWPFKDVMVDPPLAQQGPYPAMAQQVHYPPLALPMQYLPLAQQTLYPAIGQQAPNSLLPERGLLDLGRALICREPVLEGGRSLRPYGPIQEFRRPLTNAERMRNRRIRNRKQRLETSMQLVESASRAPSLLLDAMRGLHHQDLKAFDRAWQEERQHRKQERQQDRATAQLMVNAIERSHNALGEFLDKQTVTMAAIVAVFAVHRSPSRGAHSIGYGSSQDTPSESLTGPVAGCPGPPLATDPVAEPPAMAGSREESLLDSSVPSASEATPQTLDTRPDRGAKRKMWE